MEIPFVGGAYKDRSLNVNAQVCQNLYPIGDKEGGKVLAMMNTPGLSLFCTPLFGEVRGAIEKGVYLYTVIGSAVYRTDINGNSTAMTGALLTTTGPVWMKHNGTQIMIVDGEHGYILSGTTVTEIADADFPVPTSLTYQDGYFIISASGTGRFYLSGSYDGTSWDALDYATAEGDPDNLVTVISSQRELWLLGSQSYETWYNSGAAAFTFERIQGSVNRIGCIAAHSAAEKEGMVAWLDNNRYIRAVMGGYDVQKISTPQIDYQIAQYATVSDAIGYFYTQEGHTFYILTFPSEGKTWGYDVSTQLFHTRASDITDLRHRANCYAYFNGWHIVGDYENGNLYKYDLSKYSDNGTHLRRIRAAQAVNADRKLLFHHRLEIEFETGVGLAVNDPSIGSGVTPQAMLQWSDDGGHNWSNERWTTIGAIGTHKTRAVWRRLGSSWDRVYRVIVSDPVKCVIVGAHLEADGG